MAPISMLTIVSFLSTTNCVYPNPASTYGWEARREESINPPVIPGLKEQIMRDVSRPNGDWRRSVMLMKRYLPAGTQAHKELQSIGGYVELPFTAAKKGYTAIINVLLVNGLYINLISPYYQYTMLDCAAMYRHFNLVYFLVNMGANIHLRDRNGMTSLHWAAYAGNTDIVALLVQNGADINSQNNRSSTPLHLAAYHEHENVVQWLVDHGCNKEVKNADGKTALMLAKGRALTNIVEILSKP